MAIKAASTLEPNGTFALAKAKDIDVNGQRLDAYLENISAGVGEKGDKGDPGVGISKVESAEVTGGVMVTITLDDGKASAFTLKNGEKCKVLRFTYSVAVLCDMAAAFIEHINAGSPLEEELDIAAVTFEKMMSVCPKCGRTLLRPGADCIHCQSIGSTAALPMGTGAARG